MAKTLDEQIKKALLRGKNAADKVIADMRQARAKPRDAQDIEVDEALGGHPYLYIPEADFNQLAGSALNLLYGSETASVAQQLEKCTTHQQAVDAIFKANEELMPHRNPLIAGMAGVGRAYIRSTITSLMGQNPDIARIYKAAVTEKNR